MAGGAAYADYDKAYRQVHTSGKGLISESSQYMAGAVGLREASPETKTTAKTSKEHAGRSRALVTHEVYLRDRHAAQCPRRAH